MEVEENRESQEVYVFGVYDAEERGAVGIGENV